MTPRRPNRFPWPPLIYLSRRSPSASLLGIVYPLPWIEGPLRRHIVRRRLADRRGRHRPRYRRAARMMRAKTTIMPNRGSEHLVTSGPFSFTRNPIYLGNTMLTIGIGLIAGSVWFLLFAAPGRLRSRRRSRSSARKGIWRRVSARNIATTPCAFAAGYEQWAGLELIRYAECFQLGDRVYPHVALDAAQGEYPARPASELVWRPECWPTSCHPHRAGDKDRLRGARPCTRDAMLTVWPK